MYARTAPSLRDPRSATEAWAGAGRASVEDLEAGDADRPGTGAGGRHELPSRDPDGLVTILVQVVPIGDEEVVALATLGQREDRRRLELGQIVLAEGPDAKLEELRGKVYAFNRSFPLPK